MIPVLMALYLQWLSVVGLLKEASTSDWYSGQSAICREYDRAMMTLEDKITQYDMIYRPATGTTLEVKPEEIYHFQNQQLIGTTTPYFETEPGLTTIEWYKNPYFSCPKCKSGQVQAMMTPMGSEKEFVFDCHCEACQRKWRIKIPVILEQIDE